MAPFIRHDSSHAAGRIRTGNFPAIVEIGGMLEIYWTKKFSDASVGLYSSASKNVSVKRPWGSVKDVKYENRKNKKGEFGEYLIATDEFSELVAFKVQELCVGIIGMNSWTQECARLLSENKIVLFCKYLSLLSKSEGFRFFEDIDMNEEELKSLGGSMEEFSVFSEHAKENAIKVGALVDVPKNLQ